MKGYRTILANALMAVMPVLSLTEIYDVLPPEWLPWYGLFMALANMFLRSITTTSMGQKK